MTATSRRFACTLKSLLLLCGIVFASPKSFAENKDSLLNVALTAKTDTAKISAYLRLAYISRKDSVAIGKYARTGLQLAEKINFKPGIIRSLSYLAMREQLFGEKATAKKQYQNAIALAKQWNVTEASGLAYRNISAILKDERKYDDALRYNDSALRIFRAAGDSAQLETLYGNIGRIYLEQDKFNEAISYFIIGMKAYERSKNHFGIAKAYNDIGSVYERMGDQKKALESFLRMIEPAKKAPGEEQLAVAYQNVGATYYALQQDSQAVIYIQKAYDLNKSSGRKNALLISIFNLAGVKNRLLQYDDAIRSYEECIALAKELEDEYLLAHSYQNIAVVYSSLKQNERSKQYFQRALDIEPRLQDAQFSMLLYDDMSTFYGGIGDYKNAYHYKLSSDKLRDSLTSVEKEMQIAEIQTQYETEKKERKISEQELLIQHQKSRTRNILAAVSALVAVMLAGFAFYAQRAKAKRDKQQFSLMLEAEQKERMRIARDLHDSLGQMLSAVKMQLSSIPAQQDTTEGNHLQTTKKMLDRTIDEVRHISHNLIPEELNFGLVGALEELCSKVNTDATKVSLSVDEQLQSRAFSKQFELSLYRIIQEVVHNMLKHASAKEITVRMEQRNNSILLDIRDDGKGFDLAEIQSSKGLGWKNIVARVSLLNGKMNINSERIKGTQIQIIVPQ